MIDAMRDRLGDPRFFERAGPFSLAQVAESRGMNLVLHRSQVALNVQEFDITDAVVIQLNKALPTVQIPPDNVDPATLPKDWGTPVATAK